MATFNQGRALVVGTGGDLPGTVDDAEALAGILTDPGRCAYPAGQVCLLTGRDATRERVLTALDALAQSTNPQSTNPQFTNPQSTNPQSANSQSTTIIYFSGHGYQVTSAMGTAYFLVTHDYDLADLAGTCISGVEFTAKLRAIAARRLLVILDCCRAGGIGQPKAPGLAFTKSPLPPEAESILGEGQGRVIIASSRADEVSFAGKPYSAFTVALLESFSGRGVDEQDGYVRVSDLVLHAREVVPGRTGGRQHPTIKFHRADNFAVAYYAGGAKEPRPLVFPLDPQTAAVPEPPAEPAARMDLRQAQIDGSVVGGDVKLDGGSVFVGRNQTIVGRPGDKM